MKEAAGHQHNEGVERRAGNAQWSEDILARRKPLTA
jgi:hypothetical protein